MDKLKNYTPDLNGIKIGLYWNNNNISSQGKIYDEPNYAN